MNLFDDLPSSKIILNEKFLHPLHNPAQLINRDSEIQSIALSVKSFLTSKTPQNLFIYGNPGTGKTSCTKYVLSQLEEYSNSISAVYVNCWEFSTSLALYSTIATKLELPIPRRGIAKDEISSRISEIATNENVHFLIVLDELDGLVKNGADFLYHASRSPFMSLIGVSNKMDAVASLDHRIRSSLNFSTLEFQLYSYLDLKSIVLERAKYALRSGSYDEELVDTIAKKSADSGDARFAIGLLLKAARNAEKRSSDKVTLEDIPSTLFDYKWQGLGLSEIELAVLDLLKSGEKTSTEIYSHLSSIGINLSKRRIRVYLDSLEEKKLVKTKEIETGTFFKPRFFSLN